MVSPERSVCPGPAHGLGAASLQPPLRSFKGCSHYPRSQGTPRTRGDMVSPSVRPATLAIQASGAASRGGQRLPQAARLCLSQSPSLCPSPAASRPAVPAPGGGRAAPASPAASTRVAPPQVSGWTGRLPAPHLRGPWGPQRVAALGTRSVTHQSPETRHRRPALGHPPHGSAGPPMCPRPARPSLPRPPGLCPHGVCFLGNHSGVVLSINSREMHSYLVS